MSDDREHDLDETLEETFPASDAPANTVETGVRLQGEVDKSGVTDNRQASRFEVSVNGDVAVLEYQRSATRLVLVHTEVPPALRGQHIADRLAKFGVRESQLEGLKLVVVCPFVKAYLQKHPDEDPRRA